ncbi:GumC family protein [Roseibium sp.]|uniref:GumC family protein n=1 Tax=Roseibium sp. TaxID=1936156 RepID=UPI003A988378
MPAYQRDQHTSGRQLAYRTKAGDPDIHAVQDHLVDMARGHVDSPRKYDGTPNKHHKAYLQRIKRTFSGLLGSMSPSPRSEPRDITPVTSHPKVRQIEYAPVEQLSYESEAPFLDLRSIAAACLTHKWLIILLACLGMIVTSFAMLSLPSKYTATASLYFDPAQAQFKLNDETASALTSQAVTTLINSQLQILTSIPVLQRVVTDLSLTQDSEFRISGPRQDDAFAVATLLKRAVSASRSDASYVVTLNATTNASDKSANIANAIVNSYQVHEAETNSAYFSTILDNLNARLAELGAKLQSAERAVDDYRAKNDLVTAKGDLISEDSLLALNQALVAARQKTIAAKAKLEESERLNPDQAIAGSIDNEVTSATLTDLRRQYANAVANLGQLQTQLGASHPRLSAAKASLEGLRTEIRSEIKRIASTAQSSYIQAQKAEQQLSKELSAQKALKISKSGNEGELESLVLQATSVQQTYEAMLKRVQELTEQQGVAQSGMRVLGKAEPPLVADGPGRSMRLIGGIFGGLLFGLALGIAVAVIRQMIRQIRTRQFM